LAVGLAFALSGHASDAEPHWLTKPAVLRDAPPLSVDLGIQAGDTGPLEAREVRVTLANNPAGIEPIRRPATRINETEWRVDNITIPVAGSWTVKVDILVSDFQITIEGTVRVPQ
jgi:copper transport protein